MFLGMKGRKYTRSRSGASVISSPSPQAGTEEDSRLDIEEGR